MKKELIYEGKAKKLYTTDSPELAVVEYKDDATAFDGTKRGTIYSKGVANNRISAMIFKYLEEAGIGNHFEELIDDRHMLVKRVEIVPIEVVVRNTVAGSLSRRLGLAEGTPLPRPVVEFYYKNDELHDPMVNDDHIRVLNLASPEDMEVIERTALQVNQLLVPFFARAGIDLIDFKLEFGRYQGKIILADEISPDTCRLWDTKTGTKLDKDRFRRDLGGEEEAYQEVLKRLEGVS
ncbi:MAG: phosphoribosylaminoimidazolesuccinocarboxamide synthase [Bacillota bacterium]